MKSFLVAIAVALPGLGLASPASPGGPGIPDPALVVPVNASASAASESVIAPPDVEAKFEAVTPITHLRQAQTLDLIFDFIRKLFGGSEGSCNCARSITKRDVQTFALIGDILKKIAAIFGIKIDGAGGGCLCPGSGTGGSSGNGGKPGGIGGTIGIGGSIGTGIGGSIGGSIGIGSGSGSGSIRPGGAGNGNGNGSGNPSPGGTGNGNGNGSGSCNGNGNGSGNGNGNGNSSGASNSYVYTFVQNQDGSYQYVFNVNGGTSNAKTCTYNTQTKYSDQDVSNKALACLTS